MAVEGILQIVDIAVDEKHDVAVGIIDGQAAVTFFGDFKAERLGAADGRQPDVLAGVGVVEKCTVDVSGKSVCNAVDGGGDCVVDVDGTAAACEHDAIVDARAAVDRIVGVGKDHIAIRTADDVSSERVIERIENPIGAEGCIGGVDGAAVIGNVNAEVEGIGRAVDDDIHMLGGIGIGAEMCFDARLEISPDLVGNVDGALGGEYLIEDGIEHQLFGDGIAVADDL